MRKVNNIIKNTVISFIMVVLPVSCLLEKDGPSVEREGVMIEMNVSAGEVTRALPEEDPTSVEKVIKTLRVYAFYGEALAGYTFRGETVVGESFYMDLNLPKSGVCDVEFFLIANEEEMAYENGLVQLSERMTKEQLKAIKYTGHVKRTSIPMYCNQTEQIDVDNVTPDGNTTPGHEGHYLLAKKVTFILARSVAKLSVFAAKAQGAASDPQILSVALLASGTREYSYLFPQSDDVLKAITSRANDRVLLSAPVTVTNAVAKGTADAENPSNYTSVVNGLYIPEVANGTPFGDSFRWNVSSGDPREAMLNVRYTLGEGQDIRNGYICLPRIVRNDHIKILILINAEGQIIINYSVADWSWDESMMQDWFFYYPTHTYVWHKIPQNEDDLLTKPGKAATMSASQPFEGYFQMTHPVSDKWIPTLEGLNASYCDIRVYNARTEELKFTSDNPDPLEVSEDWFRITVIPKPGYLDPGDVVNLAITYVPGGMTESEYILINGSYQDYLWDESTSENYITIKMVN